MQQRMQEMTDNYSKTEVLANQVQIFFEKGLLKNDEYGMAQVVQNPAEQEHIRKEVTASKQKQRRQNVKSDK